jgi:hypothetical protein
VNWICAGLNRDQRPPQPGGGEASARGGAGTVVAVTPHTSLVLQCQRSHRWLSDRYAHGDTVACPGPPVTPDCPGGETYDRLDAEREGLVAAVQFVADLLHQPEPPHRLELWRGELPETKPVQAARPDARLVYVQRGSDADQTAFQLGHEAAHVVLRTGPGGFGWRHEMIAVLTSVEWTRATRSLAYHARTVDYLRALAAAADPAKVLSCERLPYPTGMYGWLYMLGTDLIARVGWQPLVELAEGAAGSPPPPLREWLIAHKLAPSDWPQVAALPAASE